MTREELVDATLDELIADREAIKLHFSVTDDSARIKADSEKLGERVCIEISVEKLV